MKRSTLPLLALLALLMPAPAAAQSDEEAVVAVIQRLFDAMRAHDEPALRAVLHPSTTLLTVGMQGGVPRLQELPIEQFIQTVSSATRTLDEQFWGSEVRIDGPLATVWSEYAFYVDGTFSHCGVDAFQLARLDAGWVIVHIADTRRREGCEIPDGVGPANRP